MTTLRGESGKEDFPPLFPAGRHVKTLAELRSLCVDGFPKSSTRRHIMDGLDQMVAQLIADGIQGELWIDGSFTTQKIDPNDADVALRFPGSWGDVASPQQLATLLWLQGPEPPSIYICDTYAFPYYVASHPFYSYGEGLEAYWLKQWGMDRSDNSRGMAVIQLLTHEHD